MSKYDDAEKFITQEETTRRRTFVAPNALNRAAILAAIPTEHRGLIDRHDAAGAVEPIDEAAKDLWWYACNAEAHERLKPSTRGARYFQTLQGNLERGWGMKAALGEAAGSGASIIPTPVERDFVASLAGDSVVRNLATIFNTKANVLQVAVENSPLVAYVVPETTTITDSFATTQFTQQVIVTKVMAGFFTASNQTLQDEIAGLNAYFVGKISEKFGALEDRGALDGTNWSGVATAAVTSMTSVNSIASGGAQPSWSEMQTLIFLALQSASRARFFMHPRALLTLTNVLATTGQPIVTYGPPDKDGNPTASILGFPISTVASLSTGQATYTSSSNIYFGDPRQILFADAAGVQVLFDPFTLFSTAQTRIRVIKRTGILCPANAGMSFMRGVKS